MKAEIKTTEYRKGHLIVRRLNDADIYVLVTGEMPDYHIVGYIRAQDLLAYETELPSRGKKYPAYKVSQDDLVPIEDLMARATTNSIRNANKRRTQSGKSNRPTRKKAVGSSRTTSGRRRVSAS